MKIACIGAGFAGLGVSFALLHRSLAQVKLDLFDSTPIAEGVSGLSSGLLNPYAGMHANRLWKATEGLSATHALITEATRAIGSSCLISNGILRPALTDEQERDFRRSAERHEKCFWWEGAECEKKVTGLQCRGGLYIEEGLTLDVRKYLQGLYQACVLKGAQFFMRKVENLDELSSYDHIILAAGGSLQEMAALPTTLIKGQLLEMKWPEGIPPLFCSLISKGYLVMGREGKTCFAGTTYEKNFDDPNPNPSYAIPKIKEKIVSFFPSLADAEILSVRAGVRITSQKNHLPIIGKLREKLWIFGAVGSKGLLYHAWLGDCLAQALLEGKEDAIPEPVSVEFHKKNLR